MVVPYIITLAKGTGWLFIGFLTNPSRVPFCEKLLKASNKKAAINIFIFIIFLH
jgi:hypothetical protein